MTSLLVVDGTNLFHRAFHGLRNYVDESKNLSTSEGVGTWGVYGFINTLSSLVRRFEPTHVLIAFDDGKSTRRLQIYPEYKSNRKTSKEPVDVNLVSELYRQMETAQRLCRLFSLPVHSEPGVEADDILANLAIAYKSKVEQVILVSGDHDLQQLVDENVIVVKPQLGPKGKEEIVTVAEVERVWGVEPPDLVEIWALTGDSGDGIPGVPGVGPKTAMKLIEKYGSASQVCLSDEKKILGHEATVWRAMRLIELDGTFAKCEFSLEDIKFTPYPDRMGVEETDLDRLLHELEFESILLRWEGRTLWRDSTTTTRKLNG